ncbi:MAG: sulfatase [Verrucomicrobia bacterium]|nr:sulfatase [Verrucomicrobiota bacterium]
MKLGRRITTLMSALLVLVFHCSGEEGNTARNILFIAVDDLKPVLGCYGDTLIQTPNIDRLADAGTVFLNNHCQQAVCGPSRASLMTGLRPDHTRVWDLKTRMRDMNPDTVSLPQYLRSRGFETAGTGKIYDPRCVDKQLDEPSWSIPYSKPDHLPNDPTFGKAVLGAYHGKEMRDLFEQATEKGLKKYGDVKNFLVEHDAWPVVESVDVPDGAYTDGAIATEGIRLMKELKGKGKPFFLAVGFKKPHLPFVAPSKYWNLYDRDDFKVTPFQQKSKNGVDVAYHTSGELRSYTGIPDFDSYSTDRQKHMAAEKQKELIHGYYACVSYIDAQVGRLLDELKSQGLDKNTVIVLWGDHGWHFGDHGLWCKHTNFEQATRSPLIFSSPDIPTAGETQSPTEFIDIFPTLCELTGVPIPRNLDGTSLVPLLKNPEASVKDYAVSQWPGGGRKGMGYAIRDHRYRYVAWLAGGRSTEPYDPDKVVGRELYDYQKDPMETVNVVDAHEYKSVADKMSRKLQGFFETQQ